jgi:hypothetical protein
VNRCRHCPRSDRRGKQKATAPAGEERVGGEDAPAVVDFPAGIRKLSAQSARAQYRTDEEEFSPMMPTLLDLAIWAQFQPNPGGPFGPAPRPAGPPAGAAAAAVGTLVCIGLFYFVLIAFFIIVQWKIFTKAGEPGWAAIIPIYNALVLARICGRQEVFGLVYLFVPCVGAIILCFDLAAAFGKDAGFAIGLLLLGIVFFPILAFGDAEHVLSRRTRRRRRHRDDDDEDDRPRRRRPADDDDEDEPRPRRRAAVDEDEDDRPRRRPAAQDDRVKRRPVDDRPRRRPADDDDNDEPRPRRRRGGDDDY